MEKYSFLQSETTFHGHICRCCQGNDDQEVVTAERGRSRGGAAQRDVRGRRDQFIVPFGHSGVLAVVQYYRPDVVQLFLNGCPSYIFQCSVPKIVVGIQVN